MICRSNMIPFGNGDYHKGLFIDGRLSVDFERELDKVTFGKCEIFPCDADLPCPYEDSSAQIFLHGSCDLFAKQLREKFNYDIYEILDKKGRPIHWYAQSNYRRRTLQRQRPCDRLRTADGLYQRQATGCGAALFWKFSQGQPAGEEDRQRDP